MRKSKLFKFLGSLKLAVIVILAMTIYISWGTFVESITQDAEAAKSKVYQSLGMTIVFIVFAINLSTVLVDRWPWRRKHLSFVFAHLGILTLLLGALVTQKWGIDGTMRIPIGEKSKYVYIPETQLTIWSSFDGDIYTKIFEQDVQFYKDDIKNNPIRVMTDQGELRFTDWYPYGLSSQKVTRSDEPQAGSALQFTLTNAMTSVTQWMIEPRFEQGVSQNFGPAKIYFTKKEQIPKESLANELYLYMDSEVKEELLKNQSLDNKDVKVMIKGNVKSESKFTKKAKAFDEGAKGSQSNLLIANKVTKKISYVLFSTKNKNPLQGQIEVNETLNTPWMNSEFKILQFLPHAQEILDFEFVDQKSDMTNSVVKLEFNGKSHYLQKNDVIKLFTDKNVYYVSYGQVRLDINTEITLKDFKMDHYPGTNRPATYQSLVTRPDGVDHLISMNEPLKHNGFTFYQASFQPNSEGQVVASILSVNQDPGRWIKYIGSLVISIGVVILFYDRRKLAKAQLAPKNEAEV